MKIFYQTYGKAKKKFSKFLTRFFKKKRTRIGIYGPPNAGKTTLANRIARDWTGDAVGPVSEIPHGNNPDNLVRCVNNWQSSYLMLHHHMGSVAYSLVRTHRNEWRTHDFFYMYSTWLEIFCHHLAGNVFFSNNTDRLAI